MLTKRQEEILLGTILGDGSFENRGTANSRLQIRHSYKQRDYVNWLYGELANFVLSKPRRIGDAYFFRTRSLPLFTKWRERFYKNGIKSVPKNISLTVLSLAVWFMDDGYFNKKAAYFCTHSFTKEELIRLQKCLIKFGLESSFILDRGHYKIRLFVGSTPRFVELVKQFMHPSLLYKIGIAP
jgi:hypothetical protein